MIEAIYIVAGVAIGWWLRGKATDIAMNMAMRLFTSDVGKATVLESLRRGLEKLERNP